MIASALAFSWPFAPFPAPAQQPPGDAQLRQELDAVKEQLRRVEQQMRQPEELIPETDARRAARCRAAATRRAGVAAPAPAPGSADDGRRRRAEADDPRRQSSRS